VLEAADLPAQLVPLLLAEALYIGVEVSGEAEPWAGDEPRARGAVTARAENARHHLESRRVLRHELESDPPRRLARDPAGDGGRDRTLFTRRGDNVLFICELAAGEADRAVRVAREGRDPVRRIADREGHGLGAVVFARYRYPLRSEEDAGWRSPLCEPRPRCGKLGGGARG